MSSTVDEPGAVVRTYDREGRLVEVLRNQGTYSLERNEWADLSGIQYFQYQGDSTVEVRSTDSSGRAATKHLISYTNHRPMSVKSFDARGSLFATTDYAFDQSGKNVSMTETNFYDGRTNAEKFILHFDANQRLVGRDEIGPDGRIVDSINLDYDKNGNVVLETHCCNLKYRYVYTYVFDSVGNWTRQTRSRADDNSDKEALQITFRTLSYW